MERRQQFIVENFLNSLDMEMNMIDHFRNAMRDAFLYKWQSKTLIKIMTGIEDAYLKVKEEV